MQGIRLYREASQSTPKVNEVSLMFDLTIRVMVIFFLGGYLMRKFILVITGVVILFASAQAAKMEHPKRITAKPEALEAKPFAEHHVVFHISTGDAFAQKLVLNNAQNLSKHFGPDKVAIEVVAYGPGLRLLFKENEQAKRIKSLAASGIKFSACGNTMKKMKRKESDLVSVADTVSAGVARIVELQEAGWSYVRP